MTDATVTDWHTYFREIRLAREEAEILAEENDDIHEIVEASRPAKPSDLNASLNGTIASLTLCGFWSASQVTVAYQEGKVFKTGERAGESRPDKFLTNVFIYAAHPDHRVAAIWYQDGKLQSANIGVAGGPHRVVRSLKALTTHIEGGDE